MGKIIRLTESDLVRLVKKVIKENEFDMDMGFDCDRIIDEMEYVYMDVMKYYNSKYEEFNLEEMYDELESELGGLLDMAYDNDCENIQEVELIYEELLDMFVMETGLNS